MLFNIYHAAVVSRRQVQLNTQKWLKNVDILVCGANIWNHHEKCIQLSTNMPSIKEKGYETIFSSFVYVRISQNGDIRLSG